MEAASQAKLPLWQMRWCGADGLLSSPDSHRRLYPATLPLVRGGEMEGTEFSDHIALRNMMH